MALKFYTSVAKGLKLSQKVLGVNTYVCRSNRGKTGRGGGVFLPPMMDLLFYLFQIYLSLTIFVALQANTNQLQ